MKTSNITVVNIFNKKIYFNIDTLQISSNENDMVEKPVIGEYLRITDYSNLRDIKKIFFENSRCDRCVSELKDFYNKVGREVDITCEKEKLETIYSEDDNFLNLDIFMYKWFTCKCNLNETDVRILQSSIKNILTRYKKINLSSYPTLNMMREKIVNGNKNRFDCKNGIEELYINEYGEIQRCIHESDYLCIHSVDDLESCKECDIRYICGGVCETYSHMKIDICKEIYSVFKIILYECIS